MPTTDEKLKQLWRCDCPDEGKHTDKNYHWTDCNYVLWIEDKEAKELMNNGESEN